MKKVLILGMLFVSIISLNAQVDEEKKIHMTIQNNRSTPIDVKVKMNQVQVNVSTDNYFCWDVCYTPGVVKSTGYLSIPASGSTDVFSAYYVPNGETDTTTVEYCFNIASNVSDSICQTMSFSQHSPKEVSFNSIAFSPLASVSNLNGSDISIYPNPANNFVNVNYGAINNGFVTIVDMLGKEVAYNKLDRNVSLNKIDLNGLNEGVYFLSVYNKGEIVKTEKLIISN